jgi:hypothetical protein
MSKNQQTKLNKQTLKQLSKQANNNTNNCDMETHFAFFG